MTGNDSDPERTQVTPHPESDLEVLRAHLAPKYDIVKKLGSGGMADVYLGVHNQLKRKVAIKVLPRMFGRLGHLDQLLAVWEWRATPTPWAIMVANEPAD